MGEIIEGEKHEKGAKRRPKKHSTNIDMTPMVDLMCLLITFFMLTTAFSKPKVMEITMPEKGDTTKKEDQTKVQADRTINILITSNDSAVYYYVGLANPNKPPLPTIYKSSLKPDGLRKYLLEKNKNVFEQITALKDKVTKGELLLKDTALERRIKEIKKSDKKSPIILIKADKKAKYHSIVDVIDEMAVCNIAQYAVVDISDIERKMLESAPK